MAGLSSSQFYSLTHNTVIDTLFASLFAGRTATLDTRLSIMSWSWSRLLNSMLQFIKSLLWIFFPSFDKENDRVRGEGDTVTVIPESVNYHFTRQCNYNCKGVGNIKGLLIHFFRHRRILFSHGQNVISPSDRRGQERSRNVEGGGNEESELFWW